MGSTHLNRVYLDESCHKLLWDVSKKSKPSEKCEFFKKDPRKAPLYQELQMLPVAVEKQIIFDR